MPELPDVTVYVEALERFIVGRRLERAEVKSPFLLRSLHPEVSQAVGKSIQRVFRLGKRVVWSFEEELFLVFHLMIAGRFHWRKAGVRPRGKSDLAAFGFEHGTLLLTEAGSKKRASLHVVRYFEALAVHDPGGLEVPDSDLAAFREALLRENHTLKRSLTGPRLFSGIGNAYSDEILHAARLSPLRRADQLSDEEISRLHAAAVSTLRAWIDRLRRETGEGFPRQVTAFRASMAVHGRFGQPCPDCGGAVQRIVYAENETNYCPRCQTGGKILADRSLSRLLKDDWPRTVDELEG